VMPKGVEHINSELNWKANQGAISSVMPKGVEHRSATWGRCLKSPLAISSVMPKGVEHRSAACWCGTRTGDFICDAERR